MQAFTANRVQKLLRGSEMINEDNARVHQLCALIFGIAKKHLALSPSFDDPYQVCRVSWGKGGGLSLQVCERGYRIIHFLDGAEQEDQRCCAHLYEKNNSLPAELLKRLKPNLGVFLRDAVNTVPESRRTFESLIEYAETS